MEYLLGIALFVLLIIFVIYISAVRSEALKDSPCKALRESGACPFSNQYGIPVRSCKGCPHLEGNNDKSNS